jgi:hypothetical protein
LGIFIGAIGVYIGRMEDGERRRLKRRCREIKEFFTQLNLATLCSGGNRPGEDDEVV